MPTLVCFELLVGSPYPGSASSRLPTQIPSNDTPAKTRPDPSSTPGLILSAALHVVPNTSPSGPCLVPTYVPIKIYSESPSPGPTPSMYPSLETPNYQPDKNDPAPLSPSSIILTETTATPFKHPTEYPSVVQNYIIVAAPDPPTHTSTGYLPQYIPYSCPSAATLSLLLLYQPESLLQTLRLILVYFQARAHKRFPFLH